MQVQSATPAQLAQLESYSFLSINIAQSLNEGLSLEQLSVRAWWGYFAPQSISEDFDGWIDYAEAQGWDPEQIDMHLCLC